MIPQSTGDDRYGARPISVFLICKIKIAGGPMAAQETFDAFRELDHTRSEQDLVLWNMRPTDEADAYLIDVEAEGTDDEDEARARFSRMLEETRHVTRGIAFSDLQRVEDAPVPGL